MSAPEKYPMCRYPFDTTEATLYLNGLHARPMMVRPSQLATPSKCKKGSFFSRLHKDLGYHSPQILTSGRSQALGVL